MQSSRLALRQSCRAHNAYSVASAVSSAFSTVSRLRQEAIAAEKHEGTLKGTPNVTEADTGSFASYESLSEQFRAPRKRSPPAAERKQDPSKQIDTSLAARQAVVDSGRTTPVPPQQPVAGSGTKAANHIRQRARAAKPQSPTKPQPETPSLPASDAPLLFRKTNAAGETFVPPNMRTAGSRKLKHATLTWKARMQWIGKEVNNFAKYNSRAKPTDKVTEKVGHKIHYEGKPINPEQSGMEVEMPLPWALEESEVANLSAKAQLEQEIARFAAFAEPTPAEKAARQAVVAQTCALVEQVLDKKDIRAELFGSEKTGLALATSDIDIRVFDASSTELKSGRFRDFGKVLVVLFKHMNNSPDWICVVFRDSNYPIISAQHRATGIDVQIVSSPSTTAQQQWTQLYLDELPHLRTLYPLVRTMLGIRGLVDVFNGGIGSYGLFMMLVAALKRRRSPDSNPPPPTTAGDQLLHFLNFYAKDIDLTTQGLTIEPTPKPFLKHPGSTTPLKQYIESAHHRQDPIRAGQWAICQTRILQPYLLCLQDPASPTNDLGRKSNAIKHIVETLRHVGMRLKGKLGQTEKDRLRGKEAEAVEVEGRSDGFLVHGVGRCHEVYAGRRGRVEEFGRGVLEKRKGEKESEESVQENVQEVQVENGQISGGDDMVEVEQERARAS